MFICALATFLPGDSPSLGPRHVHAGQLGEPRILLHVGPSQSTVIDGLCRSSSLLPPCDSIDTSGGLYPTLYPYVMLFIAEQDAAAGVASVEFGIDYDAVTGSGVDIYAWDACQPAETRFDGPGGAWPSSGSGVRVEWDPDTRCQRLEPGGPGTGVMALAGHFYLSAYTPDTLSIMASPGSGQARVGDCSGAIQRVDGHLPVRLGQAVFSPGGAVEGYNPCLVGTPVQPTTWSRVKRLRGP